MEFPFLTIDNNLRSIHFKRGKWQLNDHLVIPPGFNVHVPSGTTLDLVRNSFIKSFSPIHFSGTESAPILIHSSDASGQGVFITSTGEKKSILNHVIFQDMGSPSRSNWFLSGSLTFDESDVDILNSQLGPNRSEDLLNIKRSTFLVDNTRFLNAYSDALDSDFSNGTIRNSTFETIGNDAIDVSGGSVNVQNVSISNVGDKGISAGEASRVSGDDVIIQHAEIGVACKDNSLVSGTNINIVQSKAGIVVFQKKSEFGPGNVQISNLTLNNVHTDYLVENKSTLFIDGREIPSTNRNVLGRLYGVDYGKRSR